MNPKAPDYELLDAAQIVKASDEDQIWEAYASEAHGWNDRSIEL